MPATETLYLGLSLGTWFALAGLLLVTILAFLSSRADRKARAEDGLLDREHQLALAREEREHGQALVREERDQARRLVAYSALAPYLDALAEAVRRTLPVFQSVNDPPMPEEPDREEFRRHLAAARLVGSDELRRSLVSVWQAKREFDLAAMNLLDLRQEGQRAPGNEIRDAREKIDACRQGVMDAVNDIEAQMRSDLGVPEDLEIPG